MLSLTQHLITRLSRLALATDSKAAGTLAHIGLVICNGTARFAATTGKILVCCVVDAPDTPDCQVVLDATQFTTAMKAAAKLKARNASLTIGSKEARLECGNTASLIRLHDSHYPQFDFVFEKTVGQVAIPAVSSLDPNLMTIAQKILGTPSLPLVSFVHPGSSLPATWKTDSGDPVLTGDLKQATMSSAFWTDGTWAVLIMPITRPLPESIDLSRFALRAAQSMASAA